MNMGFLANMKRAFTGEVVDLVDPYVQVSYSGVKVWTRVLLGDTYSKMVVRPTLRFFSSAERLWRRDNVLRFGTSRSHLSLSYRRCATQYRYNCGIKSASLTISLVPTTSTSPRYQTPALMVSTFNASEAFIYSWCPWMKKERFRFWTWFVCLWRRKILLCIK